MILKIQKPLFASDGQGYYLAYNKTRSVMINDVLVGDFPKLDNLFSDDEVKIYVEGYLDKKDRLIVKRKVENQEW